MTDAEPPLNKKTLFVIIDDKEQELSAHDCFNRARDELRRASPSPRVPGQTILKGFDGFKVVLASDRRLFHINEAHTVRYSTNHPRR